MQLLILAHRLSALRSQLGLLLTNDDRPTTMHAYAAGTAAEHLPERIASLITEHAQQRHDRSTRYTAWQQAQTRARTQTRTLSREHSHRTRRRWPRPLNRGYTLIVTVIS